MKKTMIKGICGDCLVELKKFDNDSVDISFTSPPYNRKRNDKYAHYNDTLDDYYSFLCAFTDELLRVTKRYVFINVQKNYYNREEVFRYIGHYSKEIREVIIWEKSNPVPASGGSITNAYEFFFVFGKEALKSNTTYTKNVITTSVNTEMPKEHKAVMKQEIADWFIEKFTLEGDTVLDCFMGVGTTGISCKKYRRNFIGIELNRQYFEMAKENIKKFKNNA